MLLYMVGVGLSVLMHTVDTSIQPPGCDKALPAFTIKLITTDPSCDSRHLTRQAAENKSVPSLTFEGIR